MTARHSGARRHPDGAGIELHLRNLWDLVRLHVRPELDTPRATLLLHPRDVALEHVQIDMEGGGVEAGNSAVKTPSYTSFIAAKWLMSRRYTLHLTT